MEESVRTRNQFIQNQRPFPVCSVRSMIDPRLSGRTAVLNFPRSAVERESLNQVLQKLDRTRRMVIRYQFDASLFQPLDFFEFIVKCRLEHNPDFAIEFTRPISRTLH